MTSFGAPVCPFATGRSNVAYLEHENFERYGNYTRLHYEGRSFSSFDELSYAGRIAGTLTDRRAGPDDRVLAVLPNGPELTAAMQAVWSIGGIAVPVNPQWTAPELAYAIHNSGASVILTCPSLAARVGEAGGASGVSPRLLCFGETEVAGFENIALDVATAPSECVPFNRAPGDIAMLLYTSGTTARPKAVMVTHGNIPAAMEAVHRVNPSLPRRPMLHVLPMHHIFGMLALQLANRWGFPSVLLPQFDPVAVFEAIEQYRVGYLMLAPAMLMELLHHPERARHDFTSLYRIITGGASLPEPLRLSFQQAFRCRVDQGYGTQETGFVSCYGDHETYRAGSSGWPCPGIEVRIADEQRHPLPPLAWGEICVQGSSITPGYWNDPEGTRQAIREQWFYTGDAGYLDNDGYLYVTGRKQEQIIKGGENISPSEIEEVICLHPAVAEAAVIGVPDREFGEQICAVIQLRAEAPVDEGEIHEHIARYLNRSKRPAYVVFRATLPKTPAGKVNKQMLREQFAGMDATELPAAG
jgi:long-chain acyl-CoA synthetase